MLKTLEKDFTLSNKELRRMIGAFHDEMDKALSGKASSLKMIPTYVDRPTGNETGRYLALDLGGTNFRVMGLTLKGHGVTAHQRVMKFTLRKKDISSTGKRLFRLLSGSIRKFMKDQGLDRSCHIGLGFTFSFPVKQTGITSGTLVVWTKGFSASGVEGRDVVALLKRSLREDGLDSVSVEALVNDTVGTLVARSYSDRNCDVGVIIGTGTNACYVEDLRKIKKLKSSGRKPGTMIINVEWGNFNKLKITRYDRLLDKSSNNPGSQMLEKMVSGMYLGEICRLIITEFASNKILFGGRVPREINRKMFLKGEFVTQVMSDRSRGLNRVKALLGEAGAGDQSSEDRKIVRKICEVVSVRAARISAAAMVAVLTRIDPAMKREHTIAIDGSVYEKLPGFSENIRDTISELSERAAGRIRLALTKDGSGRGAAITAAAEADGGCIECAS